MKLMKYKKTCKKKREYKKLSMTSWYPFPVPPVPPCAGPFECPSLIPPIPCINSPCITTWSDRWGIPSSVVVPVYPSWPTIQSPWNVSPYWPRPINPTVLPYRPVW